MTGMISSWGGGGWEGVLKKGVGGWVWGGGGEERRWGWRWLDCRGDGDREGEWGDGGKGGLGISGKGRKAKGRYARGKRLYHQVSRLYLSFDL